MQIKTWIFWTVVACVFLTSLTMVYFDKKSHERNMSLLAHEITKIYKENELRKKVLPKLNKELQEQIKKNKELTQQYTELLASYKSKVTSGKGKPTVIVYNGSTKPGSNGKCPPVPKEVRWSYSDFRIEMEGEALNSQVKYQLNQLFKGQLVETKLPNDQYHYYVNLYELNRNTKQVVGSLKIDKLEVMKVDPLENKFSLFNPKLDMNFGFSTDHFLSTNWVADIGLSVSSYGKTKNDLRWRFVRFGAGISNKGFSISLSPVQYNLGYDLPLISNMWIMSFVGYIPEQNKEHFGLGISLTL